MAEAELVSTNMEVKTPAAFTINTEKIKEIQDNYPISNIPSDLSVDGQYDICKNGAKAYKDARIKLDAEHKLFKAPILAAGRELDAAKKEGVETLQAGENAWKAPRIAFDAAKEIAKKEALAKEEARIDEIASSIASIKAMIESNISTSSDDLNIIIDGLMDERPEEWAAEFTDKAKVVIAETVEKLKELFTMKFNSEQATEIAAKAEAERKAKEAKEEAARKVEQEAIAAANKLAADKLAADQAELKVAAEKLDADQKAVADAASKIEQDKKDAFDAGVKALADKKEAEDKARDEELAIVLKKKHAVAEKKEAKRLEKVANENKKKNMDEVVDCLMDEEGISKGTAMNIVEIIVDGDMPHVKWMPDND